MSKQYDVEREGYTVKSAAKDRLIELFENSQSAYIYFVKDDEKVIHVIEVKS